MHAMPCFLRKAAALAVVAVLAPACVYPYGVSAPAPAPERVPLPELEAQAVKAPRDPKNGVVVLDAGGRGARVTDVVSEATLVGHGATSMQRGNANLVCEMTPCLARLGVGDHDLRFEGAKVGEFTPSYRLELDVPPDPTEHRVVLSARTREPTQGYKTARIAAVIGFIATVGAIGALGIEEEDTDSADAHPLRIPLIAAASAGVLTLIVSTILQVNGQGEYVPGSSSSWSLTRGTTSP
jgi:hypothetical protein